LEVLNAMSAAQDFINSHRKRVTLMAMSGLGKTTLSEMLDKAGWYHYSADYRIGTAYLDQPILDNLHAQIRHIPMIGALLKSRTITIRNNITIDNLQPLSTFIGQLGNPEKGGLARPEFKQRQDLYIKGEIEAMRDVPAFIEKTDRAHFVNDSTGSLCEIGNDAIYAALAKQTALVYIEASREDEEELLRRAAAYPKPLYFPADFLDAALTKYMTEKDLSYIALIEPDDFSRWVFPQLFRSRLPKYRHIADTYGYTISAQEARAIRDEKDFVACVAGAIARKDTNGKKKGAC
jgi:hypothetical protein